MKTFLKSLLLSLSAMLLVVPAFAQITTSAMGGRITDRSGDPIPGATVVAVHEPSGSLYYGLTNNEGRYTITGMRSGGPYVVEISCMGYRKLNYTDVTLQLAEVYALNASLSDDNEQLTEAVVISTASSKFNTEKTGAATNINNRQIEAIPTISRSITDVTRLSPYGGNGMSFAGSDGRTANFTVDGANFNNNFGLSSNLPGGGNPISLDAIEELQVVISPYDVRQTNFIGGGVNAITKSGTNTFKGTAYVYHQNENLRGDSVDGDQISGARATDRKTTYGLTLGGPIIKNKLFFFVNAEYSKIPTVVNRWRGSTNGVADANNYISRTTVADLQAVSDYVKTKYGYDTGSYTDFPANESNGKILARLDWNINENHKLALRYNYTLNKYWNSPNATSMDGGTRMSGARMSQYSMGYANNMYSMQNLVSTWSLDLNSRLADNLSNQFLATFSKLDDIRGSNSDEFPQIDITKDDNNYISLGYELFTWNNAVHNTVANVKDDLTWYAGAHKVTGGVSLEYQMADNQYMRNGTGYYRYNITDDMYGAGGTLNAAALFASTPEIVCLTYGYDKTGDGTPEFAPAARVQFYKAGLYAQDEWSVNENFKLTAGLRIDGLFFNNADLLTNNAIYDLAYYPKSHNYQEQHIDTGKWPNSSITLSPRVGFSWDVFGNKTLKIRGGSGLFSGRLPLVFFTNMPTNGGLVQYQAQINAKNAANNGFSMNTFAGGLVTDANGQATIKGLYDKLISLGYDGSLEGVPDDVLKRAEVTSGFYTAKYALQSAQTALDECNLREPFSGRIANLEGRTYQRNDKLCTLIDDSQFEVKFKILEAELANVKIGQKVLVSPFINEEKQYVGNISSMNPMVDEKGLVLVTARIDNTRGDNDIIDGLNVKVVVEEEVRRMFVVPKDAVVERDGYHVVFLYKDGHAVWTYVDILHSNINSHAITGCARKETTINEGDVIITSGNLNLADDTEVKINNQ